MNKKEKKIFSDRLVDKEKKNKTKKGLRHAPDEVNEEKDQMKGARWPNPRSQ
jgi:hypothetical protein